MSILPILIDKLNIAITKIPTVRIFKKQLVFFKWNLKTYKEELRVKNSPDTPNESQSMGPYYKRTMIFNKYVVAKAP